MGCANRKFSSLPVEDDAAVDIGSPVQLDKHPRMKLALLSSSDPFAVCGEDAFLLVMHAVALGDESRALRAIQAVSLTWRTSARRLAAEMRRLGRAPPPPGRFSLHR